MGAGESKLASSIERGNLNGVKEALKAGEDADCNNKGDCTPLHKAAEAGYHNIAVALMDARANVHAKDKRFKYLRYEPLHFAAENGHKQIVLLLLCAGASHSSKTAAGDQPIHLAIKKNHHSTVADLISAGADLSTPDKLGKLPLQIAVEKGHLQILQSLLNAKADISAKDKHGNHGIHLATLNNHANVVSALIAANADVSVKNSSGETALHMAVEKGNVQIVSALVNAGVDISAKGKKGNQAPHLAAANGHTKVMDTLLSAGGDVSDFNAEGNQPLHLAAENGHHTIVSSLLSAGADFSTPNSQGNTAAHIAALQGHTEILKVLKKHGDDFAAFSNNDHKDTPLHSATENGHLITVQWLVRNGASLESRNGCGKTPVSLASQKFHEAISYWFDRVQEQRKNVLEYAKRGDFNSVMSALDVGAIASTELLHRAVLAGKARVVQAVLGLGTDFEQTSFLYRYRPLHYAAERGHSQVVQELLKAGADHTATEYRGRTAMHIAATAGHEQVLEVMKTFRCDLQILSQNRYKWTPLHYAAWEGQLPAVKWLVWNGADVDVKDPQGNTPVMCASKKQHKDIVWWLSSDMKPHPEMNEENSASTDKKVLSDDVHKIQNATTEETKSKSKATWCNHEQGNCEVPEICYMSVEGTCHNESKGCQRLHSNRHYHWQVKEPFGSWLNLPEKQVKCLEQAFCDPGKDSVSLPVLKMEESGFSPFTLSDIMGKESWSCNLGDMALTDPSNRRVLKLRRLCSEKLDGKPVKPSPFSWYFMDRNKKWVKYGNTDTSGQKDLVCNISSFDIEKLYIENASQSISFKNSKYQYSLDFSTMTQTNVGTKVGRVVRRRPQPHVIKLQEDVINRIRSDKISDLPSHWESMEVSECLRRIELSQGSKEYQDICDSLKDAVNPYSFEKIERIQHPFMWFAFQNKIREMSAIYGNIHEVNVCQLFHGTNAIVIDKICSENFDWRLHGTRVGQLYGRGTYFSPNVKTAYGYCKSDSSGRHYLFLAQVAVGTCIVGNADMVRPPPNPNTGKMFDSTVDCEFNPNIIVKYDKQEYYPEYIVTINNNPFTRIGSATGNNNANCVIS